MFTEWQLQEEKNMSSGPVGQAGEGGLHYFPLKCPAEQSCHALEKGDPSYWKGWGGFICCFLSTEDPALLSNSLVLAAV